MRHVATLIVDGVDEAGVLPGLEDMRDEKMCAYVVIGGRGLAESPEHPVVRGVEVLGPAVGDWLGAPTATLEVQVDEEPVGGDYGILGGVLIDPGAYEPRDIEDPPQCLDAFRSVPVGTGIHLPVRIIQCTVNGGHVGSPSGYSEFLTRIRHNVTVGS